MADLHPWITSNIFPSVVPRGRKLLNRIKTYHIGIRPAKEGWNTILCLSRTSNTSELDFTYQSSILWAKKSKTRTDCAYPLGVHRPQRLHQLKIYNTVGSMSDLHGSKYKTSSSSMALNRQFSEINTNVLAKITVTPAMCIQSASRGGMLHGFAGEA